MNLPKTSFPFVSVLLSLGAFACSANTDHSVPATGLPIAKSTASRDIPSAGALGPAVAANNAFALNLYGQLAPTVSGGNLITSPLSASLALTMTYAGAKGQTATEMASALQLGNASPGAIFDGQNALTQALDGRSKAAFAAAQQAATQAGAAAPSASDYALEVVNSVWGEQTYTWVPSFLDVLAESYGTGVYLQDFIGDSAGATQTINTWVSSATSDKINNLLSPSDLDSSTRMVLINAVHLKMPWLSPFDPSLTASGPFTRGDGTKVTASFMNQTIQDPFGTYAETDQAQVLTMPLAGSQLSVVLALPKNGLAALVASLTPATWASMTTATGSSTYVVLSVPKLTFATPTFSLMPSLQALGMHQAFEPGAADFDGLYAGGGLYIAEVLQKATISLSNRRRSGRCNRRRRGRRGKFEPHNPHPGPPVPPLNHRYLRRDLVPRANQRPDRHGEPLGDRPPFQRAG